MKLHAGQSAPLFSKKDVFGNLINLDEYKGKKVLVSFFRNVICPFCNLRIHQLKKMYPSLQSNLEIIIFLESEKKIISQSIFHTELDPIPIIADPKKKVFEEYGVENSLFKSLKSIFSKDFREHLRAAKKLGLTFDHLQEKNSKVMPADFLIREDLNLEKVYYGNNVHDHLPLSEIRNFAQK